MAIPNESRGKLEAAMGVEIRKCGRRKAPFRGDGVRRGCDMEFCVTDAVEPLAAGLAIVGAGNEVVFDKEGCIRDVETGA